MEALTSLPNIGKTLAEKLEQAGIHSFSDLKEAGAENAFIRLACIDETACINMLYALEGALQGIRWHQLSSEHKQKFLEFFHLCKAKK